MACFSLIRESNRSLPDGFLWKSSEFSSASFLPPASTEKWVHWLLWFSSLKMLLLPGLLTYEQEGSASVLDCQVQEKVGGMKEGQDN